MVRYERLLTDPQWEKIRLLLSKPRRRRRGIALVCAHKKGRICVATEDGRALRWYCHRRIIERTIAWLENFRCLVVRYGPSLNTCRAFFPIACFMVVLRRVVKSAASRKAKG